MKKGFFIFFICLSFVLSQHTPSTTIETMEQFTKAYLASEEEKQLYYRDTRENLSSQSSVQEEKNFRKEVLQKVLHYDLEEISNEQETGNLLIGFEIDEFRYNIAQNARLSIYDNGVIRLHHEGKTHSYRLSANDTFQFTNHLQVLEEIFLANHTLKH